MKIVATLSTVLLALAATPPATADSIDQPPDVDGNISSHFVNDSGFNAKTAHVGMRPGVQGLVDDSFDPPRPWDEIPCCTQPPWRRNPYPIRWGPEAHTRRVLLYWDFGPNGLDLTGHTVTGDATLTVTPFEWWANTHSNLEVYAVPTTLPAPLADVNPTDWRRLEDANGNLKEGKQATVFDQGAFPPNDCINAPFPCPEGTSWNNFGRDPNRIPSNDANVDPNEGNSCDGIGTDLCDGDAIMNMIIADKANRIDEVNLVDQLRDAVEQIKGVPFEQVVPTLVDLGQKADQLVEFGHNFSNAPPVTITVPQATVQNWIDNPDENGGLLFTMQNDRILLTVAGDANNDGATTGADLIEVQQNFGETEEVPSGKLEGDANDDGSVTGADLISVQQKFGNTEETVPLIGRRPGRVPGGLGVGANELEFWTTDTHSYQQAAWPRLAFETTPPNGNPVPVPEPAVLTLVGLAGLLLTRRR